MTKKIFWDDPYLCEAETRVARVAGDEVTLDETILFALSGGQESDSGTIGGLPVIDARKVGSEIFYRLAPDHGLVPGAAVRVTVDWARRYALMRLHFAAELVLGLVIRKLPGIEKIGAHIAADKARIDFAWGQNIAGVFPEIVRDCARIIAEDQTIQSAYSDRARERRYWKISDFGQVPCGGTHLRRTGEIGEIRLKRKNIGKEKERIEVYLEAP